MAKLFTFFSAVLLGATALAQPVQQVTVTGRIIGSPLAVGGFGDQPLARTPIAASLLTDEQLRDAGARNLSDLTRLDAAVSDAYNAEGYWSILSVRGFTLDNRFNYRRDGLPINAETSLPLDNKQRIELLKGISGIQAGTSSPGGLVNLLVKRPGPEVRSAFLGWREDGTLSAAVDVGGRFGPDTAFGLRVNAAAERLDPQLRNAEGNRHLLAVAGDWQLGDRTLLEAEFETSRQSQPSQPGFSMLGNTLPSARDTDPRLNLNNQPWSLPVVFEGNTASLRWTQQLGHTWRFTAHGMTQHLTTQDLVAFPYGCSVENLFDRYCSDGRFDFYDFRSENEHRRSDALDLQFAGSLKTGPIAHQGSAGVLLTRFKSRFQPLVFNNALDEAGNPAMGNIDGTAVTFPNPVVNDDNTNRDERSTEWYVHDAMQLAPRWTLWAGLRHTELDRQSIRTGLFPDDLRATDYSQSVTTPWLALAWQWTQQTMAYASWGQGIESDVAPNRARFTNAGEPLPVQKSHQWELGLKHDGRTFDASAAWFDIDRPLASDVGVCDDTPPANCTRQFDGTARQRGLEALVSWDAAPWRLHASAMWLDAKRHGASDPTLDGRRPTNVPSRTLRLLAEHDVGAVSGLSLLGALVYEGDRMTARDSSVRVPSWTRIDLGARYVHHVGAAQLMWRAGVDNVADRRAWKEAPFQFDHIYLYPMAPRTWRVSLQVDL